MWAALAPEAVKDKEAFYASQQRTSSGFMRYAKTTLELLITLTGDREIVSHSTADSSCLRHVLGGGGGVKHMKYIKQLHSNHLNYHPGTSTQCFMRYAKTKLKLVPTPTGDRDIASISHSVLGGGNGQGHVLTGCGVLPGNVESMPCSPAQLTIAVSRGPLQAGALRVGVFLPSRGFVGR